MEHADRQAASISDFARALEHAKDDDRGHPTTEETREQSSHSADQVHTSPLMASRAVPKGGFRLPSLNTNTSNPSRMTPESVMSPSSCSSGNVGSVGNRLGRNLGSNPEPGTRETADTEAGELHGVAAEDAGVLEAGDADAKQDAAVSYCPFPSLNVETSMTSSTADDGECCNQAACSCDFDVNVVAPHEPDRPHRVTSLLSDEMRPRTSTGDISLCSPTLAANAGSRWRVSSDSSTILVAASSEIEGGGRDTTSSSQPVTSGAGSLRTADSLNSFLPVGFRGTSESVAEETQEEMMEAPPTSSVPESTQVRITEGEQMGEAVDFNSHRRHTDPIVEGCDASTESEAPVGHHRSAILSEDNINGCGEHLSPSSDTMKSKDEVCHSVVDIEESSGTADLKDAVSAVLNGLSATNGASSSEDAQQTNISTLTPPGTMDRAQTEPKSRRRNSRTPSHTSKASETNSYCNMRAFLGHARRPSGSEKGTSQGGQSPASPNTSVRRKSFTSVVSDTMSAQGRLLQTQIQSKASAFSREDVASSKSTTRRTGSFTVHASEIAPASPSMAVPMQSDINEAIRVETKRLTKHVTSRAYANDRIAARTEQRLKEAVAILPSSSDHKEAQSPRVKNLDRMPSTVSNVAEDDALRERYLGLVLPLKWLLTALCAIVIALEAASLILGSHALVLWKLAIVETMCDSGNGGKIWAFLFFLGCGAATSVPAAALVTYVAPHAGGGGITEVIACLNGVEMPLAFTFNTWLVRSIGLIAVTSAGLFAGPEGPFVHIGSLVALGVLRGPKWRGSYLWTPILQGHKTRCEFLSQGAAMGVSAAFGAPLGGVLFSLEEASSFWNSSLTWRTFFGCIVAAVLTKLLKSGFTELSVTGFIEFPDADATFAPWELSVFLLVGVILGLFGALFCFLVGKIGHKRKDFFSLTNPTSTSKKMRIAEVAIILLLTITVCFWISIAVGCEQLIETDHEEQRHLSASGSGPPDLSGGICPEGYYSDIGFILLQPKEAAVKALFSRSMASGAKLRVWVLLLCFAIVYGFTVITFGSAIPCGLFIPNILSGACLGRASGEILIKLGCDVHPGVYALMGSTAMLSGFSRMTIALVMIMLEITNNMNMLVPTIVVAMVSKVVADYFVDGVNHQVLHLNSSVHMLADALSEDHLLVLEGLTVHDACVSEVVVLREREPVGQIMSLLMSSIFQSYPVVDAGDRLVTIASRIQLVNALAAYDPHQGNLIDVRQLASETTPDIVTWNTPVAKAYQHFRASGLQNLCITDEGNKLLGILTRTDFARFCGTRKEGVDTIKAIINNRDARAAAGYSSRRVVLTATSVPSESDGEGHSSTETEREESIAATASPKSSRRPSLTGGSRRPSLGGCSGKPSANGSASRDPSLPGANGSRRPSLSAVHSSGRTGVHSLPEDIDPQSCQRGSAGSEPKRSSGTVSTHDADLNRSEADSARHSPRSSGTRSTAEHPAS